MRGTVSPAAHGAALAVLLADTLPESDVALAAIPQPAGLGRVCCVNVCHRVAAVLVCGADPGPRDAARSSQESSRADDLRDAGDGLARLGSPLAQIRDGFVAACGTCDAAGGFRAQGGEVGLRPSTDYRLAHHDFPTLFRGPRDKFRILDGDDAGDSVS